LITLERVPYVLYSQRVFEFAALALPPKKQQGGLESLHNDGYKTDYLFPILTVADVFRDEKLITPDEHEAVKKFIAENQH